MDRKLTNKEEAVVKVQRISLKDKVSSSQEVPFVLSKGHRVNAIKQPKFPTKALRTHAKSKMALSTKTSLITEDNDERKTLQAHASKCYQQTKNLTDILQELKEAVQTDLHSHDFTKWNFNELYLAQRRLRSLKRALSSSAVKKRDITDLSSDREKEEEKADSEKNELWQEFIKLKQERHFNIGRITKYLTD